MVSKPYKGSLSQINQTIGLWVNLKRNSNLTVAGLVPNETRLYLTKGWNMVGFPSFDPNYTVLDLKISINATEVEGFDATSPPYYLRVMQDSDTLEPGRGYWVKVPANVTWIKSPGGGKSRITLGTQTPLSRQADAQTNCRGVDFVKWFHQILTSGHLWTAYEFIASQTTSESTSSTSFSWWKASYG